MRLLILGASGATGSWLTRFAVERGHAVTAVVRSPLAFATADEVVVKRGDVSDPEVFDGVLPGHDAVISALGLRRAALNPWSRLLSPPNLTSNVARHLAPAMQRHGVRRLLALSAGGVADSVAQCSWAVKVMVWSGNVGVAYRDLAAMEEVFANTDLDWCAVRPVTLVNGSPRGPARPVGRFSMFSTVRRSEVAQWMIDAIEQPGPFSNQRILLGR